MKKTYILAVSGGVDSVVLLHRLSLVKPPNVMYVVAHVNHGIRETASADEELVKLLAEQAGYEYETTELRLGSGASEQQARDRRYAFLFEIARKYKAEAIITAHHQDDVLETMIINLMRGTTARGLIGYTQPSIVRPFINKQKIELLNYAKKHKLTWHEDETNQDEKYLRNYVRLSLLSQLSEVEKAKLLTLRENVLNLYRELDDLTKKLLVQSLRKGKLVRSQFVVLPYKVQCELMAMWLRLNNIQIERSMIERAVTAAKVLRPGKQLELSKKCQLLSEKHTIVMSVDSQDV